VTAGCDEWIVLARYPVSFDAHLDCIWICLTCMDADSHYDEVSGNIVKNGDRNYSLPEHIGCDPIKSNQIQFQLLFYFLKYGLQRGH
jgi:hypothetical protein